MKKLAVWILSAALCASLASCASNVDGATQNDASNADSAAQDGAADVDGATHNDAADADGAAQNGASDADSATQDGAADADAIEAAYQEKLNELEQASENGEIHWAAFECGTGEKVLAVAPSVYADGEAIEADVYQYADGEVKFIASVSSNGTAYPLAFTRDAILFSGNHMSGKLAIFDGAGELSQITDVNIEGKTPLLATYAMENGEGTLKSSEELSTEEAYSLDYYANAFADGTAEIISFQ